MAHKSLSIRREGAVLAGEIPVERNPIEDPLNPSYTYGTPLYDCFVNFVVKDLYEQGIPVEHPTDPGCARMKILFNEGARSYGKSYNICLNCGQKFSVDENNFSIERKCTYHNDRRQSSKTLGSKYRERVWACCGQNKPCIVSEYHVRDVVNYERMPGFVKAPPCKDENKFPGIYAIDCEMCHTTEDHELTRVTVINHERKVVYESFCKPLNPIIDYCTRFSGVAEKDLENVNTTLADIHRDLFKFVNEKTILVGHGLGSDMKALKLLHKNIVDTSCIFLQRRSGFKQKLRDLAQEYLKRSIQEGVNGHCSEEDALAALDLMFHRIKEVCKANKPRTIISLDMVR